MRERCGGNQCQQALQNKPITCQQEANQMSTNIWFWHALSPPEVFSSSITAVLKGQSKEILENSRGFINSPVLYSSTKVIHVATE